MKMKDLLAPERNRCTLTNLIACTLLVVLLAVVPLADSAVTLIWTMCVFVIMAASLNITMGFMGQLALGHMGFMAAGAYTATYFAKFLKDIGMYQSSKEPIFYLVLVLAILVGAVAAGIMGLVVGLPALRLRGDYLAILTLGFGLVIKSVLDNVVGATLNAADCHLYIPKKGYQGDYLWLIVLITIICIALMFCFVQSKFGRAIKSVRDNEIAASASGINTSLYKTIGFVLSAAFAGVAGVLYAAMMSSLLTNSFTFVSSTIYNSVFIVVMVVLGGMGSMTGSIVAGAAMVWLDEILVGFFKQIPFLSKLAEYPMLLYALVLIIFVMFRPRGIFGTKEFSLYKTIVATPGFFRSLPERFAQLKARFSKKPVAVTEAAPADAEEAFAKDEMTSAAEEQNEAKEER